MVIDILYLAKGRRAYTEQSFRALLENTDWDLVNRLIVYDDGSTTRDNSRIPLKRMLKSAPVAHVMYETKHGSPVGVMNDYLIHVCHAEVFAKIDNDIMVGPGWLNQMLEVLHNHRELRLLGMQADMGRRPPADWDGVHTIDPCSHIGGVGLMHVRPFRSYGLPTPRGYFGFTEWQHEYKPKRAWIAPDIKMFGLDLLPYEPWLSIREDYIKAGIQRRWPTYIGDMSYYTDWWKP